MLWQLISITKWYIKVGSDFVIEPKITFVVFTYNEERRIEYVLRCFYKYGKILVMDNYSTDKTVEIAKRYGAEVCLHKHPGWVEEEKVAANVLSKITTPWVYWAYTDEILSQTLLKKLVEVSKQDKYKLVVIPKRNLTYGIEDFVMLKKDANPRFFKKGYVSFKDNIIHQMGTFLGQEDEILYLDRKKEYSIIHCSTYNIEKYINSLNLYSSIEANQRSQSKSNNVFIGLFFRPIYSFLKIYLYEGNWRFGYGGIIMCIQLAIYQILIYSKIWELDNNITIENIERRYDLIKSKIISGMEK